MLGLMAVIGLSLSPHLIGIFRDDPDVIEVGTFALRVSCIALFFQPLCVMANMTFQSTGNRLLAVFTAMLRSGLYFIPTLVVLEHFFGITGIQVAQPAADVLAFCTVLPFIYRFVKKL